MLINKVGGVAAVLCMTCGLSSAQQLNFESLPGVTAEPAPSVSFKDETTGGDNAECTTAFEVVGMEDNTPKRVYKCTRGNITITSETPPPDN